MTTLRIAHTRRTAAPESRIERAANGLRWHMVLTGAVWGVVYVAGRAVFSLFGA